MSGFVWVCSFPKSGNTFMRSLIANYFYGTEAEIPPSELRTYVPEERVLRLYRPYIEEQSIEPAAFFKPAAYVEHRAAALACYLKRYDETKFVKSHSAYGPKTGEKMFPAAVTAGVLHIVRDPRDVLVSFADHFGLGLDEALKELANPELGSTATEYDDYTAPMVRFSSWSGHAESWLKCPLPRVTLRYEDLLDNTEAVFGSFIKHISGTIDQTQLDRAIERSAFKAMRKFEEEHGFAERSSHSTHFFRSGKKGGWRLKLTKPQNEAVIKAFGPLMETFGYLD